MENQQINSSNEAEKVVGELQKDFKIVGSHRVHSWYAWAIVGIVFGMALGIVYVANRSGRVENSDASMGFPGKYGQQNEPGMMGPFDSQENEQYNTMMQREPITPFGSSFTNSESICTCDPGSTLDVKIKCEKGSEISFIEVVGGDISSGADGWDIEEVDEKAATVLTISGDSGPLVPRQICKNSGECTGKCSAPMIDPALLKKASKETGKACSAVLATEETRIRQGSVYCQ